MAVSSKDKLVVSLPVTLPQIAEALRKLTKSDLETVELLLDKKTGTAIWKSAEQARRGQIKEIAP